MLTTDQQHQTVDDCNTATVSYDRSIQRQHGQSDNGENDLILRGADVDPI